MPKYKITTITYIDANNSHEAMMDFAYNIDASMDEIDIEEVKKED